MAPLCAPVAHLTPRDTERVSTVMRLATAASGVAHPTLRQEAFAALADLPHFDRGLATLCLPCEREYDLDVAHAIVRLGSRRVEFAHQELASWRRRGLFYPLLVAAHRMPAASDWLPAPLLSEPSAQGLGRFLSAVHACQGVDACATHIEDFIASQDPSEASARAVMRVLDRLAVLMRVKSDAAAREDHLLDRCLRAFPRLDAMDAPEVWAHVKPALEAAMPPSVLCADFHGRTHW
jgi:hypothetical protein